MSMWGESIVAKINPKMAFSYYSRFCPILRYSVSGPNYFPPYQEPVQPDQKLILHDYYRFQSDCSLECVVIGYSNV